MKDTRITSAVILALLLSVGVGGWLRLSHLDAKSITHPEMYVPGIHLPEGASEPSERLGLAQVLTGTFSSDTHPPGYYVFMLPWTRAFGTSLRAIRLPSALLGAACILLLFWLGKLSGRSGAGAIAAALLALNGYHVFWSRVARMFSLTCFLGLLATILLLLIVKTHRPILLAVYAVVILAGVCCHVFFWALFATHILWCFWQARREGGPLPDICRVQLLTLIAGSPLIAFAAYQSGNVVANLSDQALFFLREFMQFSFLFPNTQSGVFESAGPVISDNAWFWMVRAVVAVIGIILMIQGLRSMARNPAAANALEPGQSCGHLWTVAWLTAAAAALLTVLGFVYMTRALPPDRVNKTLRITETLAVLPLLWAAVAIGLEQWWQRRRALPPTVSSNILTGSQGLLAMLAIVPVAMIAMVSFVRPFLNQRGMLFVAPYLLLVLAAGITALPRRASLLAALAVTLAAAHGVSLASYAPMTVDPADYTRFAAALGSQADDKDLVFVRKAYYATPILYYLPPDRYRIFGRDFSKQCRRRPDARVWVVLLYETEMQPEMQQALAEYKMIRTIEGQRAKAILFGNPALIGKSGTGQPSLESRRALAP